MRRCLGPGETKPGKRPSLPQRILRAFEDYGATPPDLLAIRNRVAAPPPVFQAVLDHLRRNGRLIELSGGLLLAPANLERMAEVLRQHPLGHFTVRDFKQRLGISSRWAIPLLEALDERGVTRRDGDRRVLVTPQQRGALSRADAG